MLCCRAFSMRNLGCSKNAATLFDEIHNPFILQKMRARAKAQALFCFAPLLCALNDCLLYSTFNSQDSAPASDSAQWLAAEWGAYIAS